MIVEFQFDTPLLEPTLRNTAVEELFIEQLDAAETIPLRTVCWLDQDHAAEFETATAADRTVREVTRILTTDHGTQYQITYSESAAGTTVYQTAIEQDGIFVSGRADDDCWQFQMRFPDRDAVADFRAATDEEISITETDDRETIPCAAQYSISPPQREVLQIAATRGYFDIPRQASLADLADELDISSQAASERLRRGLDSLVAQTVLAPTNSQR